jgi:hypothetical protein
LFGSAAAGGPGGASAPPREQDNRLAANVAATKIAIRFDTGCLL